MKKTDEILKSDRIWDSSNVGLLNCAYIKLPDCGTCSVTWNDNEDGYEHVSVSPKKRFNIPSWEDMCILKDAFFDEEEEVYQIHPPKSEYVNIKENCLHLWRPLSGKLNDLANGMVKMRIPKKPIYEGDGYAPDGTFIWDEWLCPRCGSRYEVDYDQHDYCPNCGQAIDWSEEDDE